MAHTCHAHGCGRAVPPRMFMCASHWRRVPKKTQRAIWREYKPGQERTKDPSPGYLSVSHFAIGELAFKPHDEEAGAIALGYFHRALEQRTEAVRAGGEDPLRGLIDLDLADVEGDDAKT